MFIVVHPHLEDVPGHPNLGAKPFVMQALSESRYLTEALVEAVADLGETKEEEGEMMGLEKSDPLTVGGLCLCVP